MDAKQVQPGQFGLLVQGSQSPALEIPAPWVAKILRRQLFRARRARPGAPGAQNELFVIGGPQSSGTPKGLPCCPLHPRLPRGFFWEAVDNLETSLPRINSNTQAV